MALENARPPFPDGTPAAVVQLIETCWNQEPDMRMSFDEIVEELQVLEQGLDEEAKEWIEMPLGHNVYRKNLTMADLEIPPRVSGDLGEQKKKTKGFRTLFNRKSTHF